MKLTWCCLYLLLYGVAAAQSGNSIAFGPYVQNVTDSGAVICWSTLSGTVVLEGEGVEQKKNVYDHHELPLTRLRPDTEYTYDVLGDGSQAGRGTFRTFPEEITPFRFVVYGDTRSNHDIHRRIVALATAENPRLIVNTGDLVSNGLEIGDWEIFFDVNRELMRGTPYYPVLGNHEKDSAYYFEFFNLPGHERYYEFAVGDVLFLMLDSEGAEYQKPEYVKDSMRFWNNYERAYFEKQKAWVEHMLDMHRDAGYIFVFFHQPLLSVKASRVAGAKQRREFWGDLFERSGVQAVICGHDHHYHRYESGGTQYITSGGGGAGLYDGDALSPETKMFKKVNHYIRVDVGESEAHLTAIDLDGETIETVIVKRRTR